MPNRATCFVAGEIPEHVAIRVKGRAVVEHQESAPEARALTSQFPHHPAAGGEVEDPLPGLMSQCSWCSFRCCSRVPPMPCTMHLGLPVVPDE